MVLHIIIPIFHHQLRNSIICNILKPVRINLMNSHNFPFENKPPFQFTSQSGAHLFSQPQPLLPLTVVFPLCLRCSQTSSELLILSTHEKHPKYFYGLISARVFFFGSLPRCQPPSIIRRVATSLVSHPAIKLCIFGTE